MKPLLGLFINFLLLSNFLSAQHSVAMEWNEVLLNGIRGDFARPTVHARNLFHTSVAMYDAWSSYEDEAHCVFLGNNIRGFDFEFEGVEKPENIKDAQEEALSYAMYRILRHRFLTSPGAWSLYIETDSLMNVLGYDVSISSEDYKNAGPAALGNYIARKIIDFGFIDGSNEQLGYENTYYEPVNDPIVIDLGGNPDISFPNNWQPLTLDVFIDQSGNVIPFNTPEFLSPEWGRVVPFAMEEIDLQIIDKEGEEYWVYNDHGPPSYISDSLGVEDPYKWGFALVLAWSSHLGLTNDSIIDISPAGLGNSPELPNTFEEYKSFYDFFNGGDPGKGHEINPVTNEPYAKQFVNRSDYGRILAEFWADGPESETPPGHWFTILNYVNSHPGLVKKFKGKGELLDDLEWDIKTYLTLGGAMHDCAVSTWGIKGYYDYIRPVSAIRYMADQGQSSDPEAASFHPHGLPLIPGYIELIEEGDELAGQNNINIGEIKVLAWRGPEFIQDPENDLADVGWILAKEWWPYQRPSFVTPPFAGYVSGHSTFSRAAAEVLTYITGDPYFPGGVGVFDAFQNDFLVFEDGPSQDIQLQWATYRDASDQTSLSRIWGGIHPPIDDIPGRKIGIKIANQSFLKAQEYFYEDEDQDGFYSYEECDDRNSIVYPGAPEICDGIDNDCDGMIDENLELIRYYKDSDKDGFGNKEITLDTCITFAPEGWTTNTLDCNDSNPNIYGGAPDVPDNGIDEDCSSRDASAFAFIWNNPSTNSITLHYPEGITADLFIYNASGQKIHYAELDLNENYVDLDIDFNYSGMYFLVLRNKKGTIIFKEKLILH